MKSTLTAVALALAASQPALAQIKPIAPEPAGIINPASAVLKNPFEDPPATKRESAPADDEKAKAVLQEKDDDEHRTMLFTGVSAGVAFMQMILFLWQLALMRTSVKDATKAANAAERSATAAVALELPVIRAVIPNGLLQVTGIITDGPFVGSIHNNAPTSFSAINGFEFRNGGRTPGFPEYLAVRWHIGADLPASPSSLDPSCRKIEYLDHSGLINPGQVFNVDMVVSIPMTDEQISEIESEWASLWVVGFLKYRDFLDSEHSQHFCWRYVQDRHSRTFSFESDLGAPESYKQSW